MEMQKQCEPIKGNLQYLTELNVHLFLCFFETEFQYVAQASVKV
jgi:hypothetical protein